MIETGKVWIAALCWLVPLGATAAEADSASRDRISPPAIGERTDRLLSLQRDGAAAGNVLPIPGGEAERSYKRYIDSFSHPLPDHYLPQGSSGGTGTK